LNKLGQKMRKNQKFLSTPSNGGRIHAVRLSTHTGHQEVKKTGKHSRQQLKTPNKLSLTTKSKKSQIKAEAHGN